MHEFGAVNDTVFTNAEGFYDCEYNEKAKKELARCLTEPKKRQQDNLVGLATPSLMAFASLAL